MIKFLPLTTLLLLGGCSWFSWLPFVDGSEDSRSEKRREAGKASELVKFDAEIKIKRLWRTKIGEGLGRKYLTLAPAVVADQIIAADAYGLVESHDRFSGKRLWQTRIGAVEGGFFDIGVWDRKDSSFVTGGVGAGGGLALLGTSNGDVVALQVADGNERWRANVGSEVLAAPVVADNLVFVQTIDGRLLALEEATGEVRWSFDNQVPILTLRGTSTPVVADGAVYTGFASGKVSAVRADNGQPIWEHRIMLPEGRSELDRMVDVDGAPLVVGGAIYAGSFQGRLKSLRRADGSPLWEQEVSTYHDLAEGYGQLYVVDADDHIQAIDLESAEQAWQQEALFKRKLTSPVAFSNYVLVGDDEGYLHILAQSDGRFLARKRIDSDGLRSAIVVSDQVVYIVGNSGSLTALELLAE